MFKDGKRFNLVRMIMSNYLQDFYFINRFNYLKELPYLSLVIRFLTKCGSVSWPSSSKATTFGLRRAL